VPSNFICILDRYAAKVIKKIKAEN
jgi:hypothetical protein